MQSLLITLNQRPYVLLFLVSFVVICTLNRGWIRMILFLTIGYLVAFLSEFCSIRWGFPYGMYHYIYENMKGELILAGVPVWDSISYVFMAYAAYEVALKERGKGGEVLRAAILMTLLDIVTDPLAVRGDQWFLGKIFYYEHPGFYFGIPFSNFAGWFLVGLIIFSLFTAAEKKLPLAPSPLRVPLLGPLFYLSIMLFNLLITFWIRQWWLGFSSSLIFSGIILFGRNGFGRRV